MFKVGDIIRLKRRMLAIYNVQWMTYQSFEIISVKGGVLYGVSDGPVSYNIYGLKTKDKYLANYDTIKNDFEFDEVLMRKQKLEKLDKLCLR